MNGRMSRVRLGSICGELPLQAFSFIACKIQFGKLFHNCCWLKLMKLPDQRVESRIDDWKIGRFGKDWIHFQHSPLQESSPNICQMTLILSSSELPEVWVAVEDKLEVSTISTKDDVSSFSSTHLLDSLPAKHIIGKQKSSQYFQHIYNYFTFFNNPSSHPRTECWSRAEWEPCGFCDHPRLAGSSCVWHWQAGAHPDSHW